MRDIQDGFRQRRLPDGGFKVRQRSLIYGPTEDGGGGRQAHALMGELTRQALIIVQVGLPVARRANCQF